MVSKYSITRVESIMPILKKIHIETSWGWGRDGPSIDYHFYLNCFKWGQETPYAWVKT